MRLAIVIVAIEMRHSRHFEMYLDEVKVRKTFESKSYVSKKDHDDYLLILAYKNQEDFK